MKPKILIASIFATLAIFGGYFFPFGNTLSVGQALPQVVALFETSLASPISTSATSMTLTANAVRGGGTLSGFNCFTVDEGSAQAEFICGTVSGTTVSSLLRGVDPSTGTSTVASLQFAHRRGANVKITDFPIVTILRNQANGVETFPNVLKYANTITDADIAAATTSLVSYNLLANSLAAGAADASETVKGIVEIATQGEAASSTALGGTLAALVLPASMATDTPNTATRASRLVMSDLTGYIKSAWLSIFGDNNTWTGANTFTATTTFTGNTYGVNKFIDYLASTTINGASSPVAVFVATSTNAIWPTHSGVATTSDFLGFVRANAVNGATTSVQIDGVVSGFTGLTPGQSYYASTTGVISTTIGTAEVYVGSALSSTELLLDRKGESWQYLGSSGCSGQATVNSTSCDAVGIPFARFAVVVFTTQTSSCSTGATGYYYGTVVVAKMGQGSASSAGAFGSTSASPNACPFSNNGVGWTSTSSIRYSTNIGGSGTFSAIPSATAYFYR